jgi:hypothetical protein
MKLPFTLDKKITIGELITVISIIISAVSVSISWHKEQQIQILENATKTRVEIAKSLNKINQVIQIQLSFYELIEEDIVEASRISVIGNDPYKARDYLYEKLYKHRGEILNIIAQNDWEVAYTNLLTYGIYADSLYIKTINNLKSLQENEFKNIVKMYEYEIVQFEPNEILQTGNLIDKLRLIKEDTKKDHHERSKVATADLFSFCIEQIKENAF